MAQGMSLAVEAGSYVSTKLVTLNFCAYIQNWFEVYLFPSLLNEKLLQYGCWYVKIWVIIMMHYVKSWISLISLILISPLAINTWPHIQTDINLFVHRTVKALRVKMLGICLLSWAFLTLYEVQSEFHSRWFIWVGEKRITRATN